jgi:hypothetical protein
MRPRKNPEDTLENFIRRMTCYGMGSVGAEYWSTRHLDIKDIAKKMRNELKPYMRELKATASLRIHRSAGAESIWIEIELPKKCKLDPCGIRMNIEHLIEKYNYDFSNGMYDYSSVRFYSSVHIKRKGESL